MKIDKNYLKGLTYKIKLIINKYMFEDGEIVYDPKYKEKFAFDSKTDRMIAGRLEKYTNQEVKE